MRKILLILLFFPAFVHAQYIHITAYADTICSGSSGTFVATAGGVATPHYQWQVNSVNAGTDARVFGSNTLHNQDTIVCLLTNAAGDTVFAISNDTVVTVQHMPKAGPITGPDTVCLGATMILSDTTRDGIWGASNGNAKDSSGFVTGMAVSFFEAGAAPSKDTILYVVINTCGTDTAYKPIVICPIPDALFYVGNGSENSVCVGNSLSINDGMGTGGQLLSLNGDVSFGFGYVYGVKAGKDIIYNVVTNYCGSDTASSPITVIDTPPPPGIVTPGDICVGQTLQLVDSYASNPAWSARYGYVTVDGKGAIKGIIPGYDIVSVTGYNVCGPVMASVSVNVLPPWPIAGPDSLCMGGTIILSDSTTGGVWSSSAPASAAIDTSGKVTGLATDSVTIAYTGGTCTVSKKIAVTTLPSPIIGPDSICNGAIAVSLTHPEAGGIWTSSDTSIAVIGSATGIVSTRVAGTDTITYDLSRGCIVKTVLTIKPAPDNIMTPSLICTNTVANLVDTVSPHGAWSSGNTATAQIDSAGNLTGVGVGYVTITYTHNNGCLDTTVVAIRDCRKPANIFPNPATNSVIIEADTHYYFAYSFTNTLGQELPRNPITGRITEINIDALPRGIYFVIFFGYDNNYTVKFLKE